MSYSRLYHLSVKLAALLVVLAYLLLPPPAHASAVPLPSAHASAVYGGWKSTAQTARITGVMPAGSAAANQAFIAETMPFTIATPQGNTTITAEKRVLLSGSGVTAGAAIGKVLARALPVVSVGMVLYEIYQQAGLSVDAQGNVTQQATVYYSNTNPQFESTSGAAVCDYYVTFFTGLGFPPAEGSNPHYDSATNTCFAYSVLGNTIVLQTRAYTLPAPVPQATIDAAIDTVVPASPALAKRVADEALAKSLPLPDSMPVFEPAPYTWESPEVVKSSVTDSAGNTQTTKQKTQVEINPGSTTAEPYKVTEKVLETQSTNGNPIPDKISVSTAQAINPEQAAADSAAAPAAEPPPTDCDKKPDSIGCSSFGENDIPDNPLETENRPITFAAVDVGGNAGSCPADRTFSAMGRNFSISYAPVCSFASMLRPITIVISSLTGAFILVGGIKNG